MEFSKEYVKQSLNDVVVSFVKNKILAGEYKAGDKIIESEISAELDISRAPVREALRQLNVEGMVVFSPRKGNHVLDMTLDEVIEVFEIRSILEEQILELLVTKKQMTEKNFEYLYDNIKKMQTYENETLQEHDMLYWLNSLDIQFHRYLWQVSGSLQRAKILEGLFHQLLIVMNRDTVTLGTFHEKAEEHLRIIEALRKRDLALILAEFRRHITVYVEALAKILAS